MTRLVSDFLQTKSLRRRRVCQTVSQPALEAEAELWLHQALEVAQAVQAKMLELRAAISLNRLWRDQSKAEEGRQLLGNVYGKLTEGFTTADMVEAKELLKT